MSASIDLDVAFQDLVAGLKEPRSVARRPAVQGGEFVLLASFHGGAVVTARARSHKLVHFEHATLSVWRHTLGGPVLARVSVWTLCGQWIKFANRAQWYLDEPACGRCSRALRASSSASEVDR
jgi:hypothetical protein